MLTFLMTNVRRYNRRWVRLAIVAVLVFLLVLHGKYLANRGIFDDVVKAAQSIDGVQELALEDNKAKNIEEEGKKEKEEQEKEGKKAGIIEQDKKEQKPKEEDNILTSLINDGRALLPSTYQHIYHSPELKKLFSSNETSLEQKCSEYFKIQDQISPDWSVTLIDLEKSEYFKLIDKYSEFLKFRKEKYIDEAVKLEEMNLRNSLSPEELETVLEKYRENFVIPPNFVIQTEKQYEEAQQNNQKLDQSMVDGLAALRVYGHCYMNTSLSSNISQSKLYPWLTGVNPTFERFDGSVYNSYEDVREAFNSPISKEPEFSITSNSEIEFVPEKIWVPSKGELDSLKQQEEKKNEEKNKRVELEKLKKMEEFENEKDDEDGNQSAAKRPSKKKPVKTIESNGNFATSLPSKMHGRGIVLSASDEFLEDLINLIRVLRGLGNTLPIQIVHSNELSSKSKRKIKAAARDKTELPKSYEKVKELIPNTFPQQDIWYVDVSSCLTKEAATMFKKYGTKLAASFFNSFEEMLLMDLDTVPLVSPLDFFNSGHYKNSGTLFFKDRDLFDKQGYGDNKFLKRIMPTAFDTQFFGLPILTEEMQSSRFFKFGYVHLMEAGMVAINRKQHYNGLLIMMQLNAYGPVASRVWGDKELYWMGLAIAGDQNFEFNTDGAYVAGMMSSKNRKFSHLSFVSLELCSCHPGHVNESGSLTWMNSGFKNCKHLDSYVDDSSSGTYKSIFSKFSDHLDKYLKYYNNQPTRVNGAILPTMDFRKFQRTTRKIDSKLLTSKDFFNDGLLKVKLEREWKRRNECKGYLYCGYLTDSEDLIRAAIRGGQERTKGFIDEEFYGKKVDIDEKQQLITNFLGDLWIGSYMDGYELPDRYKKSDFRRPWYKFSLF